VFSLANGRIDLTLKIRDARKLAKSLEKDFPLIAGELNTKLDAYDRHQRKLREEKQKDAEAKRVQEAKEEVCKREGHPGAIYDRSVQLIDGMSIPEHMIQVPSCMRCGESLVQLADSSWKEWLAWTDSKETLHGSMKASMSGEVKKVAQVNSSMKTKKLPGLDSLFPERWPSEENE
jgi:hypothetical protein